MHVWNKPTSRLAGSRSLASGHGPQGPGSHVHGWWPRPLSLPLWPPAVPLPLLLGAHRRVPEMTAPASPVLTEAGWHLSAMSKPHLVQQPRAGMPGHVVQTWTPQNRPGACLPKRSTCTSLRVTRKGLYKLSLKAQLPGHEPPRPSTEGQEGTHSSHPVPGRGAHCPCSGDTRLAAPLSSLPAPPPAQPLPHPHGSPGASSPKRFPTRGPCLQRPLCPRVSPDGRELRLF